MAAAELEGEVIVVDNGSRDRSVERAGDAGARLVHEETRGYGAALRRGIAEASGQVVVMADADHTYPLDRLAELVGPVLLGEADIVVGARLDAANRQTMPLLHRWVGTPVLSWLNRRAAPELRVTDSQSGFRAFDRSRVTDLGLEANGMEFASEMLIRASQHDLRIDEIPTGYRARIGQSKLRTFSDGWRHLQQILLLAPDLLLVDPGIVLTALGIVLSVFGLVAPGGVGVGSLTWQPIFFSSICLVLGVQALLGGAVLAHESAVVSNRVHRRFEFVGRASFRTWCLTGGLAAIVAGLVIDAALFGIWVSGNTAPSRGLALASIAQSLLIVGSTLVLFGVVSRFLRRPTVAAESTDTTSETPAARR